MKAERCLRETSRWKREAGGMIYLVNNHSYHEPLSAQAFDVERQKELQLRNMFLQSHSSSVKLGEKSISGFGTLKKVFVYHFYFSQSMIKVASFHLHREKTHNSARGRCELIKWCCRNLQGKIDVMHDLEQVVLALNSTGKL